MLLAVYFHEEFIDIEGIAISSVFSFQASGVEGSEFDTPEADRFSGYSDASFSEQVFNIAVAEIEAEVQPYGVADDLWREAVSFVGIHRPILSTMGS